MISGGNRIEGNDSRAEPFTPKGETGDDDQQT